ncbi:hypothetical protein ABT124_46660 [Streptomyces sp. NPDC001982]|uniref:hypothetical protein n=1 Tax=Streptomyces sp. NPDC001982 TaxID=3154405 RepID=UPI0033233551
MSVAPGLAGAHARQRADRFEDGVVRAAEPVRARRLTEDEGRRLQQIAGRGKHESIRVRRAMIIIASASGTQVTAIACSDRKRLPG